MSIIKRDSVLFPALMNDIFKPDWFGGVENRTTNVPAVNIKETKTGFLLDLAIPGFKKDNFNIEIDASILTISAEVLQDNKAEENRYTKREFSINSFKRAFSLPETIDEAKINANYEAGILSLSLPKKEEALPKPKRMIEIA